MISSETVALTSIAPTRDSTRTRWPALIPRRSASRGSYQGAALRPLHQPPAVVHPRIVAAQLPPPDHAQRRGPRGRELRFQSLEVLGQLLGSEIDPAARAR